MARLPGTVAWSTGWDGVAAPAYWSWVPVLRTCLAAAEGDGWRDRNPVAAADVQALLPESRGDGRGDASRFRLFEAVAELVMATTTRTPLTIVLDDGQWADEGTFALLEFVLRAASREPLAVMVTARSDEVGPGHGLRLLLGALAGRAHVLAVAGLTSDALAELAEHAAGPDAATPDRVAELHRRTGGNPFFARELLALGDSGSGMSDLDLVSPGDLDGVEVYSHAATDHAADR